MKMLFLCSPLHPTHPFLPLFPFLHSPHNLWSSCAPSLSFSVSPLIPIPKSHTTFPLPPCLAPVSSRCSTDLGEVLLSHLHLLLHQPLPVGRLILEPPLGLLSPPPLLLQHLPPSLRLPLLGASREETEEQMERRRGGGGTTGCWWRGNWDGDSM